MGDQNTNIISWSANGPWITLVVRGHTTGLLKAAQNKTVKQTPNHAQKSKKNKKKTNKTNYKNAENKHNKEMQLKTHQTK